MRRDVGFGIGMRKRREHENPPVRLLMLSMLGMDFRMWVR
jgi:hypothetical protein